MLERKDKKPREKLLKTQERTKLYRRINTIQFD